MPKSEEPADEKEPKPSRAEELRRMIEEYVNSLREIIHKLQRKLN